MQKTIYVKCTPTEWEQSIHPVPLTDEWVKVPFEQAVLIRDNVHWQTIDNPEFGKQTGTALEGEPILDQRKRIIVPVPPPAPTPEELETARCAAIAGEIRKVYSEAKEFALVNKGIASAGQDPDYLAYRKTVEQIKAVVDAKSTAD